MKREWLAAELEAGRSIEAIARVTGAAPSTVAYWVNKHGLVSQHTARHAARGGLTREQLEPLVNRGMSLRQIGAELSVSATTLRHWLARHGLATERTLPRGAAPAEVQRTCATHGRTVFVRYGTGDSYRCLACRKQRVVARRRKVKEILVQEAGGLLCLMRLRAVRGRPAVSPSRPYDEGVRTGSTRRRSVAGALPRGGEQVRPPLRELPRGGRGRRG